MKFIVLLFLLTYSINHAQVISWQPAYVTENDSVVVIFDATKGAGGLKDYTGDVYAHTGVITDASKTDSEWKSVRSNWGENKPELKLTRIGTNLYKFVIKPTVKVFYPLGQSDGTTIKEIAFVFRSGTQIGGKYLEGKDVVRNGDIFLPMRAGIKLINPQSKENFVNLNSSIDVVVAKSSNVVDTIKLFSENTLITTTTSDTLRHTFTANSYGKKWIKIFGVKGNSTIDADSFYYVVNSPIKLLNLPNNISDGINYISSSQVTLSFYAPQKNFVYVLGDFNNWEVDSNYYMNKTPDGNRFWITINNLTSKQEYAFQYYVDGEIRVADPYAEKILDPWNDKNIPSTVYPNLKQYPLGKTENIVSVMQTDQVPYQWSVNNFARPPKEKLVIYELLIRDFLSTHSYQSLIDTIGYFKKLGINAIELMPVSEFEGNNSWGYNPMVYFAPDKYYGTKDKLKEFIDVCHQNGIAVILDIVLNHSYGLNPMVRLYWDKFANRPASNNPWFNQVSPNPVYSWGYDFNHESQSTKDFIDRVNSYWITEYKFDGFRFDFTKGFTNTPGSGGGYDASRIAILKRMADKIWDIDPTIYIILEHFADNLEEKELAEYKIGMMLWGNLNANYNEAAMGFNDNNKSNFEWISYKKRGWNKSSVVGYMESHDEERLMYKNLLYGNSSGSYDIKKLNYALSRIKLAAAFFITVPGPKMIWQFGELGYDISIDYNGRTGTKPILWNYFSESERVKLFKTYSALINLKKNYPVFSTPNYSMDVSGTMKKINLNDNSMNVTIIGNFGVTGNTINPSFQHTGKWYDYFSGDSITVTNVNNQLPLNAGEFRIYTDLKLPNPESGIITGVKKESTELPNEFKLYQNFPNPFNPSTTIRYSVLANVKGEMVKVTLKIFDVLGREVATIVDEYKQAGIYNCELRIANGELPSGIYFYTLRAGTYINTMKMMLIK